MVARIGAVLAILLGSHACAQGASAPPAAKRADGPVQAAAVPPPATFRVGMNLSPVGASSDQQPFLDRAKFIQWTADFQPIPAGDLRPDGFPARVPAGRRQLISSTELDNTPHRYVLLYEGAPATSDRDGARPGKNVMGYGGNVRIEKWGRNRIEFTSFGSSNWSIPSMDPADPIRNLHLVRQDQEAAWRSGRVMNPEWLARFGGAHFSPYRMMDWGCTNGSGQAHWADRPKLDSAAWICVPPEIMITAANEGDADLWITVPHMADDDYVRELATLARDKLAPGHKLHLEYSNEVWNDQFGQARYARAEADRLWGNGKSVDHGNNVYYGYRAAQIMAIAKPILGDRLRGVLATFPSWGTSEMDDAIASGVARAGKGSIRSLFREYATTTYFGIGLGYNIGNEPDRPVTLGWANGGAAGLDAAFRELEHGGTLRNNASLDWLRSVYGRHAAQARAWGLDLVAYEGGIHVTNWMAPEDEKGPRTELLRRLVADPRMGALYARMAGDFHAAGGATLAAFNDVGPVMIWGAWGIVPDLATVTPRYEALVRAGAR